MCGSGGWSPAAGSSIGCFISGCSLFMCVFLVWVPACLICLVLGGSCPGTLSVWGFVLESLGDFLHTWGSHLYPLLFSISLIMLSFVVGA